MTFGVICFWRRYSELMHKPFKYDREHKLNISINISTTWYKWQFLLGEARDVPDQNWSLRGELSAEM